MTIEKLWDVPRGVCAGLISMGLLIGASSSFGLDRVDSNVQAMSGTDLLVVGSVEKIDLMMGYALVAGQRILISNETVLVESDSAVATGSKALELLHDGDLVAVNGLLDTPAASVTRLAESYVPGATLVFVRGRVGQVDDSIGLAMIGRLKVDYTPAMGSSEFRALQAGSIVEATGTQPEKGGSLIASSVRLSAITGTSLVTPRAITGTSARAITGTSLVTPRAITGTSAAEPRAITGTSLVTPRAITGTSARAITGTSDRAITGTSARAITGTSARAITGTSDRAITGTSDRAITGTSARAITGTSDRAITGTSDRAITGTSLVTPRAITGTSAAEPRAITGTSLVTPSAITGTSILTSRAITGTSF
jgi:Domain of unknown function (DUF5666)